jgi:hypothetical protein
MRLIATLYIAVLVVFSSFCFAQKQVASHKVSLQSLSSAQLEKCLDKPILCGRSDIGEISDELVRRLPSLPSQQLLACFDDWRICGTSEDQASGWPISDELARRGNIHQLLVQYWTEPKRTIRDGIEHVAYHFDTPEVTTFMRKVLARRMNGGEDLYWPINYLAKKCDPHALRELATGRYRSQGCMQYETSVTLFGKCKYRPAVPYLVDTALYDFCGNIIDSAEESLHAIYPQSPKDFENLNEMQKYYCNRAKKDGFTVRCN